MSLPSLSLSLWQVPAWLHSSPRSCLSCLSARTKSLFCSLCSTFCYRFRSRPGRHLSSLPALLSTSLTGTRNASVLFQQSEAGTLFFVSDFAKAGNDVLIGRLLSEFAKKGLLCSNYLINLTYCYIVFCQNLHFVFCPPSVHENFEVDILLHFNAEYCI